MHFDKFKNIFQKALFPFMSFNFGSMKTSLF
jgi:hypothetical protein